jgi:hypothetical protein
MSEALGEHYAKVYAAAEAARNQTEWWQYDIGRDGLPAKNGAPVREVHIIPATQVRQHRPQLCWCDPVWDMRDDGVARFRHRLRGDPA